MSLAARRRRDAAAFRTIDARKIRDPRDSDEALAQCVLYAIPGDVISLHEVECATRQDANAGCSCTPITLTLGAKA